MTSGTFKSHGLNLYYETHGSGPPLVLIMGIGYDATLWELNQVGFLSGYFQTIIFDNRDVGRSDRATDPYRIDDMADDVVSLLDHLEIDQAHVLGLSMGGMIGLACAINHPDRVQTLILTGTGAAPARSVFDPIRIWDFIKQQDTNGEVFAAEQFIWLFSESFRRNREAVEQTLALLASNPNPVSPEAYHRQASAYGQFDVLDDLPTVRVPTFVIAGEQDRLTPPWICREIADRIPGAEMTVLTGEGASHALPLERPNEFNELVLSYIQAHSLRPTG